MTGVETEKRTGHRIKSRGLVSVVSHHPLPMMMNGIPIPGYSRVEHGEVPLSQHQSKGFSNGGGCAGASLVEWHGPQGGIEGLGLDGTVVADLDQRPQKGLYGNDTRGGRQLTVIILVL